MGVINDMMTPKELRQPRISVWAYTDASDAEEESMYDARALEEVNTAFSPRHLLSDNEEDHHGMNDIGSGDVVINMGVNNNYNKQTLNHASKNADMYIRMMMMTRAYLLT